MRNVPLFYAISGVSLRQKFYGTVLSKDSFGWKMMQIFGHLKIWSVWGRHVLVFDVMWSVISLNEISEKLATSFLEGDIRLFRNVGQFIPDCTESYPRIRQFYWVIDAPCEECKHTYCREVFLHVQYWVLQSSDRHPSRCSSWCRPLYGE